MRDENVSYYNITDSTTINWNSCAIFADTYFIAKCVGIS